MLCQIVLSSATEKNTCITADAQMHAKLLGLAKAQALRKQIVLVHV